MEERKGQYALILFQQAEQQQLALHSTALGALRGGEGGGGQHSSTTGAIKDAARHQRLLKAKVLMTAILPSVHF